MSGKFTKTTYDLDLAVGVARQFERALKDYAHIALGGSCLHYGYSKNDVDLYIYPHEGAKQLDPDIVMGILLRRLGVIRCSNIRYSNEYGLGAKPMIKCKYEYISIDLFFITWEPHN